MRNSELNVKADRSRSAILLGEYTESEINDFLATDELDGEALVIVQQINSVQTVFSARQELQSSQSSCH